MIKANELRIGNITDKGIIVGITPSEVIIIDGKHLDNEDVDPIPLTPDILEKCGFVKENFGWTINKQKFQYGDYFGLFDFNYCEGNLNLRLNASDCPLPTIKSLHQLQNLYFALTGEELIYTP